MFNLPFVNSPYHGGRQFDRTIQAPPIIRVNVVASSAWQAQTGDDIQQVAETILQQFTGLVQQHFVSYMHNGAISGLPQYSFSIEFSPQVTALYQTNQGTTMVTLTVYPENSATGETGLAETKTIESATPGFSFDIKADFVNWPIPAWQFHAGGATGFWTGATYGNYYYDPDFTPLPATASDPSMDDFDLGLLPGLNAGPTIVWQPTGDGPSGSQGYNVKVGGSGIAVTALSGQQYWEVTVISLPATGDVPPSFSASLSLSGPADAATYTDPTLNYTIPALTSGTSGDEALEWTWPAALDTWLSPVIGLVPQVYLDPTWTKNTVGFGGVIGLDYDKSQPRSIGAVRTSLTTGAWSSSDTTSAGDVISIASAPGAYPGFTAGDYPVPDPTPTGSKSWGLDDTIVVDKQYVCMCVVAGTGDAAGPSAGAAASWLAGVPIYPSTLSVSGSTSDPLQDQIWPNAIAVGSAYFIVAAALSPGVLSSQSEAYNVSGGSYSGTVTYFVEGPATYVTGSPTTTTSSGTRPFGDVFLAPDALDGSGNLILSGINSLGRHMPVLKGRGDSLVSALTPSQDTSSSGTLVGAWTGIDLGDLTVNDTIMIATDTKTRNVWFGKNGKWYDQSGPSALKPPHVTATTLMDGDKDTKYYPAASWREGPIHMRMLFSGTQKYAPPGNFIPYGQAVSGFPIGATDTWSPTDTAGVIADDQPTDTTPDGL